LAEHAADRLRAIDRLVYQPDHFDDLQEIEQLARVEIARGSIAVVCRAKAGIYEVERELRRLHGKRLGVIVLQTRSSTYSLRQVNPYLPATLEKVYTHLNLVDPAAGGRKAANRWGGSAEIGGSPRATGTPLTPEQIGEACRRAFQPPNLLQRVRRVASAVAGSAGIMLAVLAGVFPAGLPSDAAAAPPGLAPQMALLLTGLGGALLLLRALRTPGLYGFRRPAGLDWCALIPLALIGAVAGGVWVPEGGFSPEPEWPELLAVLVLPLGAELLFRGLVQGSLITSFTIQECDGPWFLSWPAAISAALYALWTVVLQHPWVALADPMAGAAHIAIPVAGALVFGAAAGVARERSESIASAIVMHWVCIIVALLVR
jgi:membrane protease YdiL (CAAX protease family)